MRRQVAAALVPLLLAAAAGCTRPAIPPPASEPPPPFADCATLTTPPATAPAVATPAAAGTAPVTLAGVRLPCFTGGAQVDLAAVRGPAVLNLWGSWCAPCRRELPAFQRLAGRAGDRVHVVGVVTRDDREAARSLAADLGLTFPTLYDPDERLLRGLGRGSVLPVTVLLDAAGRVRHVDASGSLDDTALAALVEDHLGVRVGS